MRVRAERVPEGIAFTVPRGITGESDGSLRLSYVNGTGLLSNRVSCTFRAARDARFLKLTEFSAVDCREGQSQQHNRNTSMGQFASCTHSGPGQSGSDVWRVPRLGRGWVIAQVIFEDASTGGSTGLDVDSLVGKNAATLEPTWKTSGGAASYRLAVRVQGPRGTAVVAR